MPVEQMNYELLLSPSSLNRLYHLAHVCLLLAKLPAPGTSRPVPAMIQSLHDRGTVHAGTTNGF